MSRTPFHPRPPICDHCHGLLDGLPPGPLGCPACKTSFMLVEDEAGQPRLQLLPGGGLATNLSAAVASDPEIQRLLQGLCSPENEYLDEDLDDDE